ncbi:pentatricopeptide repeat-containing protein [Tanacetum coccineum]
MNMYLKSVEFEYAHKVFDEMSERNVVSWNMLISGYAKTGRYEYAKRVFSEARGMNVGFSKFTYGSVLSVCGKTGDLELGRVVHGMIVVSGVGVDVDAFLSNSLVGMYSKCGRVDIVRVVFEKCGELDEVSWNSMIAGYVKGGLYDEMLHVLVKMHRCGVGFSSYVLGSVLNACCRSFGDSLICGKLLHSCSVKLGWDLDVVVGTALLDMYAKVGDINDAISVFGLLRDKNVVMYNAMISGLLRVVGGLRGGRGRDISDDGSGDIDSANQAFDLADKSDVVSWSVMICSTAHHGCAKEALTLLLIDKARGLHQIMWRILVFLLLDLFGRDGRLSDAKSFITNSSFSDAPVMWRSLLSSCRTHKNMEIGKQVAERLTELDPQSSSSYVLLYNIYNDAKMEPQVGDKSHPQSEIIYEKLDDMLHKIKKFGYVDEKLTVNHHSEKLAVTLGLLSLPLSAPVRVMKNLRVCQDCHNVMKLISKVEKREIVLRDHIRFHRFRDGICTCG